MHSMYTKYIDVMCRIEKNERDDMINSSKIENEYLSKRRASFFNHSDYTLYCQFDMEDM